MCCTSKAPMKKVMNNKEIVGRFSKILVTSERLQQFLGSQVQGLRPHTKENAGHFLACIFHARVKVKLGKSQLLSVFSFSKLVGCGLLWIFPFLTIFVILPILYIHRFRIFTHWIKPCFVFFFPCNLIF